jgi:manganese/zinc/iron transport system permease protein
MAPVALPMFDAFLLQAGYNATLVTLGSMLLGMAAGVTGTFLYLRKRSLISDALAHATLPGVGLAFLLMVALGGNGRSLPLLLVGAGLSALAGLLCVHLLSTRTRLPLDAAIGAVLSVSYGLGIVILTVIQALSAGRQAGLEGFLLGSAAGMLRSDALLIGFGGAAAALLVILFRRPLLLVAFDPGYAATCGVSPARTDLMLMVLVLAVTLTGLKVVGLILIVALLIIPPVAARLWSDRAGVVVAVAGGIGGAAGYGGAAASAMAPDLPTGAVIVLLAFAAFVISLLVGPVRGVIPQALRRARMRGHLDGAG